MKIKNYMGLLVLAIIIWGVLWLNSQGESVKFNGPVNYLLLRSNVTELANTELTDKWQTMSIWDSFDTDSIVWLQFEITIEEQQKLSSPVGLFVSILGSYTAYWDNQLIGHNGVEADTSDNESPGVIDKVFLLTKEQSDVGKHQLLLRLSSQFKPKSLRQSIWIFTDQYSKLIRLGETRVRIPLMMISGFLIVAIYCWLLFITTFKEMAYFWFGCLCFITIVLILTETYRGLWGYSYNWHLMRLQIILVCSFLMAFLLIKFLLSFLKIPAFYQRLWLILFLLIQCSFYFIIESFDLKSLGFFLTGILISIFIAIQGIFLQRKNSDLMLGGLILFVSPIFINQFSYMDQYFFLSFIALIMLLFFGVNQAIEENQKQLIKTQINTDRLTLELLKKQLQPHFLLNTLTAVEEWIEISPVQAVNFTQALAVEFRQLAKMVNQPLTYIEDEILLCQSHLSIMGFRNDCKFSLREKIDNPSFLIPPGVLLTLFENAFSHNHYIGTHYIFSVEQKVIDNRIEIIFKAPVSQKIKNDSKQNEKLNHGIGMRYIKSRFEESFFNNWKIDTLFFSDSNENKYWQVILNYPQIRSKNKNNKENLDL